METKDWTTPVDSGWSEIIIAVVVSFILIGILIAGKI